MTKREIKQQTSSREHKTSFVHKISMLKVPFIGTTFQHLVNRIGSMISSGNSKKASEELWAYAKQTEKEQQYEDKVKAIAQKARLGTATEQDIAFLLRHQHIPGVVQALNLHNARKIKSSKK